MCHIDQGIRHSKPQFLTNRVESSNHLARSGTRETWTVAFCGGWQKTGELHNLRGMMGARGGDATGMGNTSWSGVL